MVGTFNRKIEMKINIRRAIMTIKRKIMTIRRNLRKMERGIKQIKGKPRNIEEEYVMRKQNRTKQRTINRLKRIISKQREGSYN